MAHINNKRGINIVCPCKYPLHILDKRDGDDIEYMAFPDDYIDEVDGSVDVPSFEVVKEVGFDGETHEYMAVMWKDPSNAVTKKYDVAEHIVVAGCEARTDGKKIQCRKKELYLVLHPLEEWEEHHVIEL